MSESRRACKATHETVDVIATCLLESGHDGPHDDYMNMIQWPQTYAELVLSNAPIFYWH